MYLAHAPGVTSLNLQAATVQRLGNTFIDGGIHPRLGTRNLTLHFKMNTTHKLSTRRIIYE